jgi:hypothetical protein
MMIKEPGHLREIAAKYPHVGLFQGGHKIIPLNSSKTKVIDQIERIIDKLQSDLTPPGSYEIHLKAYNRADVQPDIIGYVKEPRPGETLAEVNPANFGEKQKLEVELFKKEFVLNEYTEKILALENENKKLVAQVNDLTRQLEEMEENEENPATPEAPAAGLSEAVKPFEGIIQALAPILKPLTDGIAADRELKRRMMLSEFNFNLRRRAGDIAPPSGYRETEPDDELFSYLRELRRNDPNQYLEVVQAFIEEQHGQQQQQQQQQDEQ